jgi:hypothetical protein
MRGAGPEFSLKNGESAEETRGKAAQEAAKVVQENAETVGWSLVPHLKTLLKTTRPPHDGTKTKAVQASSSRNEAREQVWVKWTLAKIEKALQLKGEDIGWLRTWRRSGHVTNGI